MDVSLLHCARHLVVVFNLLTHVLLLWKIYASFDNIFLNIYFVLSFWKYYLDNFQYYLNIRHLFKWFSNFIILSLIFYFLFVPLLQCILTFNFQLFYWLLYLCYHILNNHEHLFFSCLFIHSAFLSWIPYLFWIPFRILRIVLFKVLFCFLHWIYFFSSFFLSFYSFWYYMHFSVVLSAQF